MTKFKLGDKVRLGSKARKWLRKKYGNKEYVIRSISKVFRVLSSRKVYSFNTQGINEMFSYELTKTKR